MSDSNDNTTSSASNKSELLWSKTHEVLQRIAYKVGRDEFSLTRGDFVIRYFPWRRHAFKITKGGVIRVYFGVFPLDNEFEFYLRQALASVRLIVDTKGNKVERYDKLKELKESVQDKNWNSLPKLVAREELEIVESYKITVKHKKLNFVVIKESSSPSFSKMVTSARIEMTEMVEAYETSSLVKDSESVVNVEPAVIEPKVEVVE